VRGKVLYLSASRASFHRMPDCLGRESITPKFSHAVYATEDDSGFDFRRRGPSVNRLLHPGRYRNSSDVLSLADQIHNDTMFLPNLKILRFKSDQFSASQTTPNQNRKDRLVSFIPETIGRRIPQQSFGVVDAQPISNPHAQPFGALHAADAGC
jgi:hypothetical protein